MQLQEDFGFYIDVDNPKAEELHIHLEGAMRSVPNGRG